MTRVRLRPYQQDSVLAVLGSWDKGVKRPVVVMPTGIGKTVCFAVLCAMLVRRGHKPLICVARDELVEQTINKLRDADPWLSVGIIRGPDNDLAGDITVASVQTLSRQKRLDRVPAGRWTHVIADECFPAGTLVGDVQIQNLRPGDLVPSFDETSGEFVDRPVVHVMSSVPSSLVRLTFDDGQQVVCTPGHPFLTGEGWKMAVDLQSSVVLNCHYAAAADVHLVPSLDRKPNKGDRGRVSKKRKGVLLNRLQSRLQPKGPLGVSKEELGYREPSSRHRGTNELRSQSYEEPRLRGEDGQYEASCWGLGTNGSWRKWIWANGASAITRVVSGLADRGVHRGRRRRTATEVLSGHRPPEAEDNCRGGRAVTSREEKSPGRTQGSEVGGRRVAYVQVLEPGRDGTYGGLCPGGVVYNLEVAETHTYRVGPTGLVVHNCHWAAADSWQRIMSFVGVNDPDHEAKAVGFTATLTRTDKRGLGDVWDEVCYTKDLRWAIESGFLVPVTAQTVVIPDLHLENVKVRNGDLADGDLGKAMAQAKAGPLVAAAYNEMARNERGELRRGICFTPSIELAESFLRDFRAAGIPTELVIGSTPREERQAKYRATERGDNTVLMSVGVLTTGFDSPPIEVCVVARPTKSVGLFQQMCLSHDTQVLTDSGWLGPDDDWSDVRAAAFDPADDSIHWSDVLSRVDRPMGANESMYGIDSPTADIRVTDQHKMIWRGRRQPWRLGTAVEMAGRKSGYEIPIAGTQKASGVPLTDDEIRFLGWFMTDGSLNRANGVIVIGQSEHQAMNSNIVSMLQGCGFKYRIYRDDTATQFNSTSTRLRYTISRGAPRGEDKHLTGWGRLEPWIDKDFPLALEAMTREQLAVLLEAIHLGDGSKQASAKGWTRRSYHISTANKVFADRLQSLCVRRGFKANVAEHGYNLNPLYVIHIKDTNTKSVGGSGATDRETFGPVEFEPGERVWCVEVDTGVIVTRRNGKVAVVGNCGRALRPSPDTKKESALIMDVVGVSRLGLASIIDLDLSDPEDEAPIDFDPLPTEGPTRTPGLVPDAPDRIGWTGVDLFHGRTPDRPAKPRRKTAWLTTNGGVPFLAARSAEEETVFLWSFDDGWAVGSQPRRGRARMVERGLVFADAVRAANALHPSGGRPSRPLVGPATEGQLTMLRNLGCPVFDGMSKNDASIAISVALASRSLDS